MCLEPYLIQLSFSSPDDTQITSALFLIACFIDNVASDVSPETLFMMTSVCLLIYDGIIFPTKDIEGMVPYLSSMSFNTSQTVPDPPIPQIITDL